jgi:hypothetical protein
MTTCFPLARGVPGFSGQPPYWLPGHPIFPQETSLDDPRWRGAFRRELGDTVFRALHHVENGDKFLYLSWRVPYNQEMNEAEDLLYVGFQPGGGSDAMVIEIYVHESTEANSQGDALEVKAINVYTPGASNAPWNNDSEPSWIAQNTRAWYVHNPDGSGSWSVQMRVPINPDATSITDDDGPNLTDEFEMWYYLRGGMQVGPTYLAEYPDLASPLDVEEKKFPISTPPDEAWDHVSTVDDCLTASGIWINPMDIGTTNIPKSKISYSESEDDSRPVNTFFARPRNYTSGTIDPGKIKASFRIANWGSVASPADWENIPGGDDVPSSESLPPISAEYSPTDSPPPGYPDIPIHFYWTLTDEEIEEYVAGVAHKCMLVELSGSGLTFLRDSVYTNMIFEPASVASCGAEISAPGKKRVYLAVEKVNMPRQVPSGTSEGRFLENSMDRLMEQGGPLATKLESIKGRLAEGGDHGSKARLDAMLGSLHKVLAKLEYRDPKRGLAALGDLIEALKPWLSAVKEDEVATRRLAGLFDAAAGRKDQPKTFVEQLDRWLASLADSPASSKLLLKVVKELHDWLSALAEGDQFLEPVTQLIAWLIAGRPADQRPAILDALDELMGRLSEGDSRLATTLPSFAHDAARWLRGLERFEALVRAVGDARLTGKELDQLFPTLRIHVYHDTGERVTGSDGIERPLLRVQPSFGLYAYHEGSLEGWLTCLGGARRIADNLYLLTVPDGGVAKITTTVQAVEPGEAVGPEDPIQPLSELESRDGCRELIRRMLGFSKAENK